MGYSTLSFTVVIYQMCMCMHAQTCGDRTLAQCHPQGHYTLPQSQCLSLLQSFPIALAGQPVSPREPISTSPAWGLREDATIPDMFTWVLGLKLKFSCLRYFPLPLQTTQVCYLPVVLLVKLSCLHKTHILLCNIFSFYYEINFKVTPTRTKPMALNQSFSTIPRL